MVNIQPQANTHTHKYSYFIFSLCIRSIKLYVITVFIYKYRTTPQHTLFCNLFFQIYNLSWTYLHAFQLSNSLRQLYMILFTDLSKWFKTFNLSWSLVRSKIFFPISLLQTGPHLLIACFHNHNGLYFSFIWD